jgi:hypothetical protein
MRWFALGSLVAVGCMHVVRVTEGIALSGTGRPGGEVAVSAGRFAWRDDRGGVAFALRAAAMADGAGVSAVIGLSLEAQRQPRRRGPSYGEDTEPYYEAPRGLALRVGAHAGSSLGGELAVLWSHGRIGGSWADDEAGAPRRFSAIGVEVGGELSSARALGVETSWAAVRLVEERDELIAPHFLAIE